VASLVKAIDDAGVRFQYDSIQDEEDR
jgi:hypothetical protein